MRWLKYIQEEKSDDRCRRSEESLETNAILLLSKWRKETEGGWKMDVDITVQDKLDDEHDVEEGVIMSENEDKSRS